MKEARGSTQAVTAPMAKRAATPGSGWKSTAWTTSRTSVYLNKQGVVRHPSPTPGAKICPRQRTAFSPRREHQQTASASCVSPALQEVRQELLQLRRREAAGAGGERRVHRQPTGGGRSHDQHQYLHQTAQGREDKAPLSLLLGLQQEAAEVLFVASW